MLAERESFCDELTVAIHAEPCLPMCDLTKSA
jgi:hypothetical protein